MDLRVLDNTDTELTIEIAGETHTFMAVLKDALLEAEGVVAATYDMNPEQSGGQTEPVLTVKTDTDTPPLDALAAGAERVQNKAADFRSAFDGATA